MQLRAIAKVCGTDIDARVEIWLEKDALTGVIDPITSKYDVALNPARGYASITFLYENATALRSTGKPCLVYHLGAPDGAAGLIGADLRNRAPAKPSRAIFPYDLHSG